MARINQFHVVQFGAQFGVEQSQSGIVANIMLSVPIRVSKVVTYQLIEIERGTVGPELMKIRSVAGRITNPMEFARIVPASVGLLSLI